MIPRGNFSSCKDDRTFFIWPKLPGNQFPNFQYDQGKSLQWFCSHKARQSARFPSFTDRKFRASFSLQVFTCQKSKTQMPLLLQHSWNTTTFSFSCVPYAFKQTTYSQVRRQIQISTLANIVSSMANGLCLRCWNSSLGFPIIWITKIDNWIEYQQLLFTDNSNSSYQSWVICFLSSFQIWMHLHPLQTSTRNDPVELQRFPW